MNLYMKRRNRMELYHLKNNVIAELFGAQFGGRKNG